jgi:hypothetical protein
MNLKLCCALVSLAFSAAASAAPTIGNADVSDVTLNGHAADGIAFSVGDAQAGANGNPSVFDSVFTGPWNLLTKIDTSGMISAGSLAASGLFSNMSFVLNPDGKSGNWSLTPISAMVTDLVLGIYAGGATASFLFDDAHLSAGGNTGSFKIDWFDSNGSVPNYSNMTFFFYQNAGAPTLPPVSSVPEPETYAMMLGGLGLFGFMARRKKKQAEAVQQHAALA